MLRISCSQTTAENIYLAGQLRPCKTSNSLARAKVNGKDLKSTSLEIRKPIMAPK